MIRSLAAALAVATILPLGAATAHVTLEASEARAGSTFKAVLRVPHGCQGSPTVSIRVLIPDGAVQVKPQPKAGWQLATVKAPLAKPVVVEGATITESVQEVVWSGGKLLDEHYDEFVLRLRLPESPGTTAYFRTVQECEKGVHRWVQIPQPGGNRDDLPEPAPQLALTPAR